MTEWNEAQKQAITHKDGPMMVLAGPGSGKTTVITERTKYLVEHFGVNPSNILVITFTKAAAAEMKERFMKLAGRSLPVSFGTFHAVFFTILKHAYRLQAGCILPEHKKYGLLREIITDRDLETGDEPDFLRSLISEISLVKGQLISMEYYHSQSCADSIFQLIYQEYNKKLQRNRWMDFDDILVYTYQLLKERKDLLAAWQNKYQYILIDEFQDISPIQYEIMKLLAAPRDNLFIVGDDDQSIYRFRGAKPEIMLGFPRDYKDSKKIQLDINYRSSPEIVDAAQKVIRVNKKRFAKEIRSCKDAQAPVELRIFKDQQEECIYVAKKLREEFGKGIPFEENAILVRTNLGARTMIGKLMEYNIPFAVKDGIPSLFEHWIARDIIDYIRMALGDRRRGTFLRIMNRPKRYISREYLDQPEISFQELKEKTKDKEWLYDYIEELEEDLRLLKDMTPFLAITYIRKSVGYNAYLAEYARIRKLKEEELTDVLEELQETARAYETYEEWFEFMRSYTEELKAQSEQKNQEKQGVILSTLHSAKGLEYERVFLIDVNDGVIPYKKAVKTEELEEERRMLYVGMTRAKKYLHVFSVEKMYNKDSSVSDFIRPLEGKRRKQQKGANGYGTESNTQTGGFL